MTTTPAEYLLQLKAQLVISPVVATFIFIEERIWPERGYIRIRMTLDNGDFLEVAEYFVLRAGERVTRRYRYQWMDGTCQVLRKRWDNVEHYLELPNFPHHVHVGSSGDVKPGEKLSIMELLNVLPDEMLTQVN